MARLQDSHTSLSYLEGVAKLRCSLSVVAELLHTQQTVECWQYTNSDFVLLIEEAKTCCSTVQLNDYNQAGPAVYLVKLLMRQYGLSFLHSLCKNADLLWVVPEHLRQVDEVLHASHVKCAPFIMSVLYVARILTHAHTNKHTHNAHSQESQKMDRFVIYGFLYSNLRNVLVDAAYHEQTERLAGSCHVREMMLLKIEQYHFSSS